MDRHYWEGCLTMQHAAAGSTVDRFGTLLDVHGAYVVDVDSSGGGNSHSNGNSDSDSELDVEVAAVLALLAAGCLGAVVQRAAASL